MCGLVFGACCTNCGSAVSASSTTPTLEPHPGLTVVTGETGAGKTMIVTALDLVTGGRGDCRAGADRQRPGGGRGAASPCQPMAPSAETGSRRRAATWTRTAPCWCSARSARTADRARTSAAGSLPLATLAEAHRAAGRGARSGGGDRAAPAGPATRRARPVRGRGGRGGRVSRAARAMADARGATSRTGGRAPASAPSASSCSGSVLAEIRAIAPQPGEDAALVDEVRRLENADALRAAARAARVALVGSGELPDEPTAAALVAAALRSVRAGGDPRLAGLAGELAAGDRAARRRRVRASPPSCPTSMRIQICLPRCCTGRRRCAHSPGGTPRTSTGCSPGPTRPSASSPSWTAPRTGSASSTHGCMRVTDALTAAAARLSALRTAAAARLGAAVTAELEQLAMPRASVNVAVTRRRTRADADDAVVVDGEAVAAGVDGVDQVEIVMTAHPGAPELPIARGASGGELSRVMLALEVALAGADPVTTLVFDEVDAGVGGRAATEIGGPPRGPRRRPPGDRGDPPRAGGRAGRPALRGRRRIRRPGGGVGCTAGHRRNPGDRAGPHARGRGRPAGASPRA